MRSRSCSVGRCLPPTCASHRLIAQTKAAKREKHIPTSKERGQCVSRTPRGEAAGRAPLEVVSQVARILMSKARATELPPKNARIFQSLRQSKSHQGRGLSREDEV